MATVVRVFQAFLFGLFVRDLFGDDCAARTRTALLREMNARDPDRGDTMGTLLGELDGVVDRLGAAVHEVSHSPEGWQFGQHVAQQIATSWLELSADAGRVTAQLVPHLAHGGRVASDVFQPVLHAFWQFGAGLAGPMRGTQVH